MADGTKLEELSEKEQIHVANEILKEFCSNSTVHGVRYFMEPKRHWSERVWWAFSFTMSVAMCVFAILSIWHKWNQQPVVVTFNDKTTPIGTIPFPAVSVCTTKKFFKDKIDVDKFTEMLNNIETNQTAILQFSLEELNWLDVVMQLCLKQVRSFGDNFAFTRSESIYDTIERIGPEQSSVTLFSTWVGQFVRFSKIYTNEGLCFTFNSLNSREIYTDEIAPELITVLDNPNATYWNVEDGYQSNVNESEVYPYRMFGAGLHDSFFTVLGMFLEESQEYCTELAQGFRLSLHMPDELPQLPNEFIHIPPEQEVFISIKPNVITTSKRLRYYQPHQRSCYFRSERRLRFFRLYSQTKCEMECKANFTKAACGCIKFAMPRDKDTRICTMMDSECLVNADDKYKMGFVVKDCDCLSDCTLISFDVEVSQTQTRYSEDLIALKQTLNESGYDTTSKVFISFKQHQFFSMNRTETSTIPDFVASCGGLLGLFMGISLLSVVELIYFFTLRLCCKLRKQTKLQSSEKTWAERNHNPTVKGGFRKRTRH